MNELFSFECTLDEMKEFAFAVAERVSVFPEAGKVLFLDGEVGSGKTTFTRFFSEQFGIESNSPTYSIIESRTNSNTEKKKNRQDNTNNADSCEDFVPHTIIHGDFYRTSQSRSAEILEEYIENTNESNTIFILEWLQKELQTDFFEKTPSIHLSFSHGESRSSRKISVQFHNPESISVDNAKKMQDTWHTPVHVRNHIEMVRKIAVYCAKKLQKNNIPVDITLIESAAILHDAVRYVDFPSFTIEDISRYAEDVTDEKLSFWKNTQKKYKTVHHAHAIAEILEKEGFASTAKVASSHYTGTIYKTSPFSWEEKCVYYADKRGLHDTFVTIEERLIDGAKRYAHEKIKESPLQEKILEMEKQLQTAGNWNETDIQKAMNSSSC